MTISAQSEELDVLDAILPFDRRDQIAELLTDDVATLKHLSGVGRGLRLALLGSARPRQRKSRKAVAGLIPTPYMGVPIRGTA